MFLTFFLLLEGSNRVDFFFKTPISVSFKTSTKNSFVDNLLSPWTAFCACLTLVGNCRTQNKENRYHLASIWAPLNKSLLSMYSWRTYKWALYFKFPSTRWSIQTEEQHGTTAEVSVLCQESTSALSCSSDGAMLYFYSHVMKCKMPLNSAVEM